MSLTRNKWIRKEIMEIILYLFIGITMLIILPLMGGFSFRGFEESLVSGLINISDYLGTYLVYVFFIIGSLFLVIFPIANLLTIRKGEHPATQENPKWYRIFSVSLIFNPEDGALWHISEALGFKGEKNLMRWSTNIFRVTIIFILVFGLLGILQVQNPNLNVVGVPSGGAVEQQITPTSDIIFGSSIPSFSENGVLLFVSFFLLGITAFLCARFIRDKKIALLTYFIVGILFISLMMAFSWGSIHGVVYGSSEAKMLATQIFGGLGFILTLLFGIGIIWMIWHFFNNFFIKLTEFVTMKEDIILIALVIWGILFLVYIIAEFLFWRRRKKKRQNSISE